MKRFAKTVKKLNALFLTALIAAASVPATAMADGNTLYTGESGIYIDGQSPDTELTGSSDNMTDSYLYDDFEEYDYLDGFYRLSFGQFEKGKVCEWQEIPFTNTGEYSHSFSVSLTPAQMWDIDLPSKSVINPGETLYIAVRPRTEDSQFTAGDYTATLNVMGFDYDNCDITAVMSVNLYVSIYESSNPWVSNVSVSPSSVTLGRGSSYTFSAAVTAGDGADTGVTWSVSGNSSSQTAISSSGVLTVGNDEGSSTLQVTARSKQDSSICGSAYVTVNKTRFTVNTAESPESGGSTAGGGSFDEGSQAALVANPRSGYEFTGWYDESGNKVSSDSRYVFTVTSSRTLTAHFSQSSLRITTKKNIESAGKITDSFTLANGGSYTVTATPNTGYKFNGWYENGNLVTNAQTYSVNGETRNRELTAVFEQSSYNVLVTLNPSNGGTVSGAGTYTKGSKVTLTATPANGFAFVGWADNNNVISNSATYTISSIDRDYSFGALFQAVNVTKLYTITASCETGHGTISPSGTLNVEGGKSLIYSMIPDRDYVVSDVKVDGVSAGAVSSYIFNNIDKDHKITVSFTKNQQSAQTASASSTGSSKNTKTSETASESVESNIDNQSNGKADTSSPTTDYVMETDTVDVTELTGTLQDLNMTEDEAREAVRTGTDRPLMENALLRGDLEVTVRNNYSDTPDETSTTSYYDITSVPDFSATLDSVLSEDEKIALFKGGKIRTNLNIVSVDGEVDQDVLDIFSQNMGSDLTAASYFDIRFIEEIDGVPSLVTDVGTPLKIVMNVTPQMAQSGSEYCVMRLHDGVFDVLEDEDDSPDTITFTTDRMSVFALGYYNGNSESLSQNSTTAGSTVQSTASGTTVKKDSKDALVYILIAVIVAGLGAVTAIVILSGKKRHHR